MSFLLKKARSNKEAGFFLKEREYYAPSVHCFYYSCFQLISHILKDYFTDQYYDVLKMWEEGRASLHSEMLKAFRSQYASNFDREKTRQIRRRIKELQEYRVESDYKNEEFENHGDGNEVCFITSDSLVDLENPIKVHEPILLHMEEEEKVMEEQIIFENIPSDYLTINCENDDCLEFQKLAA